MIESEIVKCYIVDKNGEEHSFKEYFKDSKSIEKWAKKIESKALTNYYHKKITII